MERPSVQTLYENSSYLTKIGLPKPKGRVYFGSQCHCNVYSAGRREGLGEQTQVLSYNCQSLSNFPDPLLKAQKTHTL